MNVIVTRHDYEVRVAGESDIKAITGLVNRAFVIEKFFKSGDRTDEAGVARMMRDGEILLLTSAEEVVACVFVKVNGERIYAGMLASDPKWKVPGAGARMMDGAEDYGRAKGCNWMDIRIVSVRPELRRLYRKRGFTETGTDLGESIQAATRPVHFITLAKLL